jgi:Ca-activated chloride channel family protein
MEKIIKRIVGVLLLGALCLGQETPHFRTEVNLINVTALVRDAGGKLLTDLQKSDFEILEDGLPRTIQFFARQRQLPLSLALIVDVSGSQDKFLKQHNRDVEEFPKIVLGPADQAVAVCFGNHLRLVSDATSSVEEVMNGLRSFVKGDRRFPEIGPTKEDRDLGTALYDALYFTTKEKLKETEERRTICWTRSARRKTKTRSSAAFATRTPAKAS